MQNSLRIKDKKKINKSDFDSLLPSIMIIFPLNQSNIMLSLLSFPSPET